MNISAHGKRIAELEEQIKDLQILLEKERSQVFKLREELGHVELFGAHL